MYLNDLKQRFHASKLNRMGYNMFDGQSGLPATGRQDQATSPDIPKAMERRYRSQFKNAVQNRPEYFAELAKNIKRKDETKVNLMLDVLCTHGDKESLSTYRESEDETLLHIAVKYYDNADLVSRLANLCPQLLPRARESSPNFQGQTALHIALTKGNIDAVETMLQIAKEREYLPHLLHRRATGNKFINTVMMGEFPLAVAALKFEPDLFELLLKYGAELHTQNSQGDSIIHSLIKYSAIYPEKIQEVKHMFGLINSKIEVFGETDRHACDQSEDVYPHQYSYLWFLQNNDRLTPLQLAAMHGISELFEFILNIKDVYYFVSAHDGLFDVKMYDISEIDTITNQKSKVDQTYSSANNHKVVPSWIEGVSRKTVGTASNGCLETNGAGTESILEMLFSYDYESKDAFRIIELLPVKSIVKMKWEKYRVWFMTWMILHFVTMIGFTIYSVERSSYFSEVEIGNHTHRTREAAINSTRWIFLCFGILYGAIFVSVAYTKIKRQNALRYMLHNLEYIVPLAMFSVCLIVDTAMTLVQETHNSVALIIALISGWWFNIFFLRPFKKFSFFTEMIKEVIVGDMFRFGLVISFELIAFTAAMHILFNGVPGVDDFQTYGDTMMAMFKLGIGTGDIEILYMARVPWAAVTLFLIFVILTYLLMLNALIAMMSQTCALVLEERYPQWRVQQLSVILFLEDILCLCCLRRILSSPGETKRMVGFDPVTKQTKKNTRYFLEIHSLQMEYATEEDKEIVKKRNLPLSYLNTQPNMYETLSATLSNSGMMENHSFPPRFSIRQSVRRQPDVRSPVSEGRLLEPINEVSVSRPTEKRTKTEKSQQRRSLEKLAEETDDADGGDVIIPKRIKQVQSKPPPDVIMSDRSPERPKRTPESKRRRSKSENLHEQEVKRNKDRDSTDEMMKLHVVNSMAKSPSGLFLGKPELDIKPVA